MSEEERASTYDPDSEQSAIGDGFSKDTLDVNGGSNFPTRVGIISPYWAE